jgi:excisionase family DNA binding protein
MRDPERAFYSIKEFANELMVHHNTIRNAIKCGRINAFRVGKGKRSMFRIAASEIDRMALIDITTYKDKPK